MEDAPSLIQTITLAIVAGISMQILAEKVKLPSIAFLMLAGILLGPGVWGIINPTSLGEGLEVLVSLTVALILFEGGLSLDLESLRTVNQSVRNILTIGTLITITGAALTVHFLLGISWMLSILFGAFVSISGPTVINPILQRLRVERKLVTILKSECILSDALGALISVAVLEVILATKASFSFFLYEFFLKIFIGSLVGYCAGWLLGKFLKKKSISSELKNLVALAGVFGIYFLSNSIETDTGILSVIMAGYSLQKENIPQLNTLKRFKGQLSIFLISVLFILISANLDISNIKNLGWKGFACVGILMFLIRPLAIFVSNHGLLNFREKLFISWIGPKGIVSASVASLFGLILTKNGYHEGVIIESLVFLAILVTVIVQGLSARKVANLCKVSITENNIVIIGANALGRTIGTAFAEIGKQVVIVDSNLEYCRGAISDGLETVHGNALDHEVLRNASIHKASTLIATTSNSEINFLVCQFAKDEYNVPFVYPAIDYPHKGIQQKLVDEIGGNLAYAKPASIEEWKHAIDQNNVQIVEWVLHGSKGGMLCDVDFENIESSKWLPLILKHEDEYVFAHSDQTWSEGDILICLTMT